jgi:hypothetical protein
MVEHALVEHAPEQMMAEFEELSGKVVPDIYCKLLERQSSHYYIEHKSNCHQLLELGPCLPLSAVPRNLQP